MSTLHTDPIKVVAAEIFNLVLSAAEDIENLRGEAEKAANSHLDTIATDLQRALAFHEAVDGLSRRFARMSDEDNVALSLLRRLNEVNDRLVMVKNFGSNQSAAAIEGRTAALAQVHGKLSDAMRDVLRAK